MPPPSPSVPGGSPKRRGWYASLAIGILLVAFYQVENFRGERAWKACRTELMAKGEGLDWAEAIPPPVPDESNFYSAPIVRSWIPNKSDTPSVAPLAGGLHDIVRAPRPNHDGDSLPLVPEFPSGYFPPGTYAMSDLKTLPAASPGDKPGAESLAGLGEWIDQWAAGFDELYQAAQRPEARLEGSYADPITRPVPGFVRVRTVAQLLATRAKVHLLQRKPDLAMRDMDTMHGLVRAMGAKPPTLVAAMIGVALAGLYADVVQEGLAEGLWGTEQLAALPDRMATINLIPLAIGSLRVGERAAVLHLGDELTRLGLSSLADARGPAQALQFGGLWLVIPRGWIRQNQVRYAQLMQKLLEPYDAKTARLDPRRADAVAGEIEHSVSGRSPFLLLCEVAVPNITKALITAAKNQTVLNQARIACALERHRMAQGGYPERLEGLVPAYLSSVPADVLTGQPMIYRRTLEGKFVLYSIGWNLVDDGGKATGVPGDPDWVWLTSLREPTPKK